MIKTVPVVIVTIIAVLFLESWYWHFSFLDNFEE